MEKLDEENGQNNLRNFLVVVLFLVIVIAFSMHVVSENSLSIDALVGYFGLMVTAIGFLVGSYFAVMAVNAYAYTKDVENASREISKIAKEIKDTYSNSKAILEKIHTRSENVSKLVDASTHDLDRFYVGAMSTVKGINRSISLALESIDANAGNKLKDDMAKAEGEIGRMRAIFWLNHQNMHEYESINRVRDLAVYGRRRDIETLEEARSNPETDETLRLVLDDVIKKIRDKYKGEN